MPQERNFFDLQTLKCNSDTLVLVGSGPSLRLCLKDLQELILQGIPILLADSVARGLKNCLPWQAGHPPVVFSVEKRRHFYLYGLPHDWAIAFYWRACLQNLPPGRSAYLFRFPQEEAPYLQLVSPGTVMGAALAYALYCLQQKGGGTLHLIGLDFAYLDNQVYTPAIYPHLPATHRWDSAETRELIRSYQKTGIFLSFKGHLLRTSAELALAQQNCSRLLDSANFPLQVWNYSPLSWLSNRVFSKIPSSLKELEQSPD